MKIINQKYFIGTVKLSIVVTTLVSELSAAATHKQEFTNPLENKYKSTDNGGILSAIDAYKDGVGVIVLDNLSQNIQIDNSAMNTLVYKYGEAAKASGSTIVDEVMYGSGSTNTKDKVLVGKLTIDGSTCSDGNEATEGETWINGICQGGISMNGIQCDDDNIATIGDKWLNGVCVGYVNGTSCTDNNIMTVNDKYTNGVCAGTLTVNGTTCSDGNSATVGEKWLNGVCQGGIVGGIAINGLIYDNCEGGAKTWANAKTYCTSKGMRLATINETTQGSAGANGVPACNNNTRHWTSTPYSLEYWWYGSSSRGTAAASGGYTVRCVK